MHCVIKILFVLAILATSYNRAFCQDDNNQDAWLDSLARTIASMPDDSNKVRRLDSVAYFHTNVDTILKYSEWELELSQQLGLPFFVAKSTNYMGFAYYYKYNFYKSVDCYTEALRIVDSLQSLREMAIYRFALANAYSMLDNYVVANQLDCEALDFFKEMNDTVMMSETLRCIAMIYCDVQLPNRAEESLKEAMTLDSIINNSNGICLNFYYLGRVERLRYRCFGEGDYIRRSIKFMRRALEGGFVDEFVEMHIYDELMFLYLVMTQLEVDNKDIHLESSRNSHHRAFVLAEKLGVIADNRDFNLWQAAYLAEKGEFNESYQIFKTIEANYVADSSNLYSEHYISLFKWFARYYELTDDYKNALDYYRKYERLQRRSFSRELAEETVLYREDIKHQKENAKHIKNNEETKAKMRYAFVALASVIVLLVFLARSYVKNKRTNKILLDSNAEIELQRDQLKHINDEITSSIRYAQKIQEALLPQREALETIFNGCLLYWKPLEIVSGDFYWVQQTFRYKFLAVGDCTGHGVPGAFLSMLGISSLSDIVMSLDFEKWQPSAGEILNILRAKVISSLRQSVENEDDTKDGIDLALCILDTQNNELHFAGAMRPLLIYRGDECIQYSGDRIPVGVSFKQNLPFTNHIIKVCEGDTVYLFTDGVVDQFGFVDGVETKFNRKRLCAMLSQIHSLPFDEQERRIEAVFECWASSGRGIRRCPQVDDQLLIGIRL